jgi:DNA-binding CsgD family transcriptional regulator
VDAGRWPFVGRQAHRSALRRVVASGGSAIVVGGAGVGKTALVARVVDELGSSGWRFLRARGSGSARAIPLGALAPLVATPDNVDTTSMIALAVDGLVAESGRVVLCVDDVHLLDEVSAVVVDRLVATGRALLLATARAGVDLPDAIGGLLVSGAVERMELGPLSPAEVTELVAAALPGPVAPTAQADLLRLSAGLPLFVRELVLGALAERRLRRVDGVWHLEHAAGGSTRLADLLTARLRGLTGDETEALELVALAEPVGLRLMLELVEPAVMDRLERHGLVVVERDDRRLPVRLCHPLYAELIGRSMPATARLGYARRLADRLEAHGTRRREDLLRWAVWRLDGGGPVDPVRLNAAARRVTALRGDSTVRLRLTGAAYAHDCRTANGLLHFHSLLEAARAGEAEALLRELAAGAARGMDRFVVEITRAAHLGWSMDRIGEAVTALTELAASAPDPRVRAEVVAHRGLLHAIAGRPAKALDDLAALLAAPQEKVSALAAAGATLANLLAARFPAALAAADLIDRLTPVAEEHELVPAPMLPAIEVRIRGEYGDLSAEAAARGVAVWEDTIRRGDPLGQAWTSATLATVHLGVGDLAAAEVHAVEAARLFAALYSHSGRRWGLANSGQQWSLASWLAVATQRGDRRRAAEVATRLAALPPLTQPRSLDMDIVRAWAWHDLVTGAPTAALERLTVAARSWHADGATLPVLLAAHALFRLRHRRAAADLLDLIDIPSDWPLGDAVGRLVTATHPQHLLTVADTLRGLGFRLYAAEAYGLAASARVPAGTDLARRCARAAATAAALAAECGARTPLLDHVGTVPRLTPRQRQIAALAADGYSNRDLASRLGISERTVENHLHRVYTKLGVSRRAALRPVLEPDR